MKFLSKFYIVVFAVILLAVMTGRGGRFWGFEPSAVKQSEVARALTFDLDKIKAHLPTSSSIRNISVDEALVFDSAGLQIGRLLHTLPKAKNIFGHSGSLPVVIVFDAQERITGTILQSDHEEGERFIKRIDIADFWSKWNGLTASEAINLEVDAVSRATFTSKAVIESLRLRLENYLKLTSSIRKTDKKANSIAILGWLFITLAVVATFNCLGIAKYRIVIQIISVVIAGFLLGQLMSLEMIFNRAVNGFSLETQLFSFVLFILAIGFPLFFGKGFYCQWYCPFGAAQELCGHLCKSKLDNKSTWYNAFRNFKYKYLTIIVFLLILGYKLNLAILEPFSAFIYQSADIIVISMAVVFLLLSIIFRKPWCNSFCPTGVLLELLRFPNIFTGDQSNGKEGESMKFQEVINLLLVVVILVMVISPYNLSSGIPATSVAVSKQSEPVDKAINSTLQTIYSRKSVRNFTDKAVTKEQLIELVKAAMAAPTGRNIQPWQFVVMDNKADMIALAENLPYAKMLAKSAAAVIVCGDIQIASDSGSTKLWEYDCSAATQNLLLAAESMGLGAVWTAAHPYEDRIKAVRDALSLPEHAIPFCVIPIGYPTGKDKPKDKWKPERMHWNKWGISAK